MKRPAEVWTNIKDWAAAIKDTGELYSNIELEEAEPDIDKAISMIELTSSTIGSLLETMDVYGDGEADSKEFHKYMKLAIKALEKMKAANALDKDMKIYTGTDTACEGDFNCAYLVIPNPLSIPRCKVKDYCNPVGCKFYERV